MLQIAMARFVITQHVLSLASKYDVREGDEETASMLVEGELVASAPSLQLLDSKGTQLATLRGNMLKTKFMVRGPGDTEMASINFPSVAVRRTLTMTVGTRGYYASGGVMGNAFECIDNDRNVGLIVTKELSFKDRFRVEIKAESM